MLKDGEYGLSVETIAATPWLELKRCKAPEQGVHGYVFTHEVRCCGVIVAVLPFRRLHNGGVEFCLRQEITPCWGMEPRLSALTGGLEPGLNVHQTAREELWEEAGYDIECDNFISLGTCFGTKSTDTVYYLFAVDVSLAQQQAAKGDGSKLEAEASMLWVGDVRDAVDPLAAMIYLRLLPKLMEGEKVDETRSLTLEELVELERGLRGEEENVAILLEVLKLAYLKHHTDHGDDIGWVELGDKMCDALCNVMGVKRYSEWMEGLR